MCVNMKLILNMAAMRQWVLEHVANTVSQVLPVVSNSTNAILSQKLEFFGLTSVLPRYWQPQLYLRSLGVQ